MPLKLNVGVSRKVGLPEFSSTGANCNVELELDAGLLQNDPDGFQAQVREAFAAVQQAVSEERARLRAEQATPPATPVNGHAPRNRLPVPAPEGAPARSSNATAHGNGAVAALNKPATQSQVKAIYAIARDRDVDLTMRLAEQFGVEHAEELSLAQASQLIDQLKTARAN